MEVAPAGQEQRGEGNDLLNYWLEQLRAAYKLERPEIDDNEAAFLVDWFMANNEGVWVKTIEEIQQEIVATMAAVIARPM